MGVFSVKARYWNPSEHSQGVIVELLVDTGATYTILSAKLLENLDVRVLRTVKLKPAKGRVVAKPLGMIGIKAEGFQASATPVVFGNKGVYLLGAVAME